MFLAEQAVTVERHGGHLLLLRQGPTDGGQTAIVVNNVDARGSHRFRTERVSELAGGRPVTCVWPNHGSDPVSRPSEYELAPGEGLVFVTQDAVQQAA